MKSFLFIPLIAIFLVPPSTANYCTQKLCNSKVHIMCQYPNPQPAAACGKVINTRLTHAEKDGIVNTHNRLRKYVAAGKEERGNPGRQPAARNMKTLTWDNELAEIAQRWANQCHIEHDSCRNVGRFSVGQNIGSTHDTNQTTKPYDIIINRWYNEVKYMNRNNVNKYKFATDIGHYTQLVWANTDKIGCGKIVYPDGQWKKYYLVCNYGPAGNFEGQPIYQKK